MTKQAKKLLNDPELIDFLIAKAGGAKLAASALGISEQRIYNWRRRGIAFRYRANFRKVANGYGAKLPPSWLDQSVPSILPSDPSAAEAQPEERADEKEPMSAAIGQTSWLGSFVARIHQLEERVRKLEKYNEALERGIAAMMTKQP